MKQSVSKVTLEEKDSEAFREEVEDLDMEERCKEKRNEERWNFNFLDASRKFRVF